MANQTGSSLGMYIDDRAIFACGKKWKDVEQAMQDRYTTCIEWLTHAGLNIELDKTELLFFRKGKGNRCPPTTFTSPSWQ